MTCTSSFRRFPTSTLGKMRIYPVAALSIGGNFVIYEWESILLLFWKNKGLVRANWSMSERLKLSET